MRPDDKILLAHGGGGRLTQELIRSVFLPDLANPALAALSDSAVLERMPPGRPALTTDAFVVDPPVFPGGDLGYLSVCGTVNDLAVAGARPIALTWALVLEEGLEIELLRTFVRGAARAAGEAGVAIVAGDTKVVPRGKGDRAYVTTAGLGVVPEGRDLGDHRIEPGCPHRLHLTIDNFLAHVSSAIRDEVQGDSRSARGNKRVLHSNES